MTINTRSMRSSSNVLFAIVLISTAMLGCSKKDTPIPDPCLGVSYDVQYFKTEAIGSSNNGTIAITFPIGDTISYQPTWRPAIMLSPLRIRTDVQIPHKLPY